MSKPYVYAIKKYHFVYVVSCPIKGKYYIGKHSTDDMEDGYIGSGKWCLRYEKKHGKNKLIRTIISFFNTEKEAYVFERLFVNQHYGFPLCMNMVPGGVGFTSESARKNNQNKSKESIQRGADKIRGRTKHTHPYLAEMAIKTSKLKLGRRKETHEDIAKMSATLTGRTKETSKWTKAQADKIRGRTKETHAGVKAHSEKMTGRTKQNNIGTAKMAITKLKIKDEAVIGQILNLSLMGLSAIKIKDKLKLDISFNTVNNIIRRHRKLITEKKDI